jgi:ribosomal-protein-alanine N-acetyltransferase
MAVLPSPRLLRVALRPATSADAPLLRRWRSEESVKRHQPLADAALADLRTDLARQRSEDLYRGVGDRYQWIVLAEGYPAGWVTLAVTSWEHGMGEIGYALTSELQGRGVMPVALTQLLAELFGRTKLERLEARCSVENVASQKVLERAGFLREGLLRGYFELGGRRIDNYLYAILRSDFFRAEE